MIGNNDDTAQDQPWYAQPVQWVRQILGPTTYTDDWGTVRSDPAGGISVDLSTDTGGDEGGGEGENGNGNGGGAGALTWARSVPAPVWVGAAAVAAFLVLRK